MTSLHPYQFKVSLGRHKVQSSLMWQLNNMNATATSSRMQDDDLHARRQL